MIKFETKEAAWLMAILIALSAGFFGYGLGVHNADTKATQARERCNQRWEHRINRGKKNGTVSEDFELLTPEPRMFLMGDL